jgi:sulfur carrier protein
VNGVDDEFLDETVADVLLRRAIEPRGIAVALNGDVIRRSEWSSTTIPDGATIEIVTAAAGG